MARIYWDVLDCGDKDCCCKCPSFFSDGAEQICCNLAVLDKPVEQRTLTDCETLEWCPLPIKEDKTLVGILPLYESQQDFCECGVAMRYVGGGVWKCDTCSKYWSWDTLREKWQQALGAELRYAQYLERRRVYANRPSMRR